MRVIYGSESFPKDVFDVWEQVERYPHVIGDFCWAALDYIGEAGIGGFSRDKEKKANPIPDLGWPWVVSFTGDLDLTGRQKPASLARDVAWRISPLEVAVQRPIAPGMFENKGVWGWSDELQSWTWPGAEGRELVVRLYAADADHLELRLNGKLIRKVAVDGQTRMPVEMLVDYAPGILEARALHLGREIGRRQLETVGKPVAIRLTPERRQVFKRRGGLQYIALEVVDGEGRQVPDAEVDIRVSVTGPARLKGLGSGRPLASPGFQIPMVRTWHGTALAILSHTGSPGTVTLEAKSNGMPSAIARIGVG